MTDASITDPYARLAAALWFLTPRDVAVVAEVAAARATLRAARLLEANPEP